MRVIERKMNEAITANKNWRMENTEVTVVDGVSEVRLHGNLIAKVGEDFIQLFDGGFRSNTTKSRLNAILSAHGANFDGVFQKNFQWFFHDSLRSLDVPFESGMVVS